EAQVGDLVVGPEPLEDGMADLLARGLAAPAPDRLLQLGAEGVDVVLADGPVLGRGQHAGHDLVPPERLAIARALDDHEGRFFQALERGEPAAARQALAAAADGGAVVRQPRVDDLVVDARAGRAPHAPDATARHI